MTTLAFDIYGTIIDTKAVSIKLDDLVGNLSGTFTQLWRDKQLEYSFRRGLMQDYVPFPTCTEQALNYTDSLLGTALTDEDKSSLLELYKVLPAFPDVEPALSRLKELNIRIYAFSNGTAAGVEKLLASANIEHFFQDIISVDEIQTFKPSPDTYHHFLQRTNSRNDCSWLISSNPFDILGANNAGLNTAWVKRSAETIFDPWGIIPTETVHSLTELSNKF
ncbi:MAG: haloacid dehalogenase type II [Neptuniibacter sp.]